MKRKKKIVGLVGRTLFVLVLFIVLFAYAMFQGGKVSWTVFYLLAPFLLYSFAFAFYPLSDCRIQRVLPSGDREAGDDVTITLKLERKFPFPLLYTVINDHWSDIGRGSETRYFGVLGFRKKWHYEYTLTALRRGEYTATELSIEVFDFFSWIKKTKTIQQKTTILVLPKTMKVDFPHIAASFEQGIQTSPLQLLKDTSMVSGIRDYQAGDRFTWIHWKSFARTNKLMAKEFEDRQTEELTIMLDHRPSETFEELVSFTASLLREASSQGIDILFVPFMKGPTSFAPSKSSADLRAALLYLAKIQPEPEFVSWFQAKQLQRVNGSILLITSRPDALLLQPLLSVQQSKSPEVICFVVKRKVSSLQMEEAIRYAKSTGIQVYEIAYELGGIEVKA